MTGPGCPLGPEPHDRVHAGATRGGATPRWTAWKD
jgi:hypothetical protein